MDHQINLALPAVAHGAYVGILGGSFDPPHLGHQLLALSAMAIEPIDALWVIPCADHAFKSGLIDFSHRLAMCQIAFSRITNTSVLDIESRLKPPNYTIATIDAILKVRTDLRLVLCLGSDLVTGFLQWHQAPQICAKVNIAIFERRSYPIGALPALLKNAAVHQGNALPDIASSSLRDAIWGTPKEKPNPLIDRNVLEYIKRHSLYRS